MTLEAFQQQMKQLNDWAQNGCSNHGCRINPNRKGMGTNSTCQCRPREFAEVLLALAVELDEHGRYKGFDKP